MKIPFILYFAIWGWVNRGVIRDNVRRQLLVPPTPVEAQMDEEFASIIASINPKRLEELALTTLRQFTPGCFLRSFHSTAGGFLQHCV
jgi:hypothetical protein